LSAEYKGFSVWLRRDAAESISSVERIQEEKEEEGDPCPWMMFDEEDR